MGNACVLLEEIVNRDRLGGIIREEREKRLKEVGSAKISGRKIHIFTFIVMRGRETEQWFLK
jgi:hypothetical protein